MELDEWTQFKVYSPVQMGTRNGDVVDTRWVLTREEADGKKTVKARLVAKGYKGPELRDGNVDIAGCVSRRSSHSQLISLGGPEELGDLKSRHQACPSSIRWIRPRSICPCSMRVEFLALLPRLEVEGPRV